MSSKPQKQPYLLFEENICNGRNNVVYMEFSLLSLKGYMIGNKKLYNELCDQGHRVSTLNDLVRGKAFSSKPTKII